MAAQNAVITAAAIIALAIYIIAVYRRSKYFLHMIQLEGYKNKNYLHWLQSFPHKVFPKKLRSFSLFVIILFCLYLLVRNNENTILLLFMGIWCLLTFLSIDFQKTEAKKALVFTERAKRLFAINFILVALPLILLNILYFLPSSYLDYPTVLLFGTIMLVFVPYMMVLANICIAPVEKQVFKFYYNKAYNKVRTFDKLHIVGITGSYGKTSTKFIMAEILEQKFKVMKTPESYNTPMGISKVINNMLNDDYEAFVVEMGARQMGDIQEVARLVNPHIGVLTSIGPTHLETQKTIENIMKTKYELIECLPEDGIAIFYYDNVYVKELADKTQKRKILYGLEEVERLDIYAADIDVSYKGSTFVLKDKSGTSVQCTTKLLGKHNISNLLAGAAAAKALGLTMEEIAKGIERVTPIPHRLQLMNSGTGVIVIDDAFNSNPEGAKAALEVLKQFNEGRKVIVTPGMVELGEQETEANRAFGENIAESCDFAILVGEKRTKPIVEGLKKKGFNPNNIYVVSNLDDATKRFQSFIKAGDVILFENDLPDNYNE